MEANDFVARLKANGTENDLYDLVKVINELKEILSKLPSKDRSSFCLNVLCILCRNIDKVPSWRDKIDPKLLLTLSIDCVRETRTMERPDRVKTLACVYHIHRFIVRLKSPISPELVLKISFMPFECDVTHLLTEYAKTYWSILMDRIAYMEQLKSGKMAIIKLLPKLTEDILKVIQIYDTAQFCINALTFLIKKLHLLYNNRYSVELNKVFGQIFDSFMTKSDLKSFKKLSEKELMDVYMKFNDCFYVIVENSSKNNFKDSILTSVVRTYISLLGHHPEMFHCLQTFYSNAFCNLFTSMTNSNYNETIFNSLLLSCETTEKLGYSKIMYVTYPFINQLLRLYVDYTIANMKNWTEVFTDQSQENYLKIILLIMNKSKHCEQFLKCDNCKVKSGLHDALRLSFLSINFVKQSDNIDNILPLFYTIVEEQHVILKELRILGCSNYEKCYRKLQTDIHNTAIVLNKSKHYDYSIKLFNIYLEHEISSFKDSSDLKNISRALYNKSICELDCKKYDDALNNAFLSLVFACPEGLNSDKYMSLVMDIKAKALKSCEDDCQDTLQLVSVLDACKMCLEEKWYGNLKPFFVPLKFSSLLKHEFSMYAKLWPSIVPIAGVWRSLHQLVNNKYNWLSAENEDTILSVLYDVILETSAVVRSIYSGYYKDIVCELVAKFDETPPVTTELEIIQATMLFLKAEFDLYDASEKYGWKITEPSMDPDQMQVTRTICQEHEATRRAIQSVDLLTDILPKLKTVQITKSLKLALEIADIFVQQLLHLARQIHGLQLAYICCVLAEYIGDSSSYIRNAGVLLSHADKQTDKLNNIMVEASKRCAELMSNQKTIDTAVIFICDAAIHNIRIGAIGTAARLLQIAQSEILNAYEKYPDINLDLSVGRLLEAQCMLCDDPGSSTLSAASGAQRHYLGISNTASGRHSRRLLSLALKNRTVSSSMTSVRCGRALLLRRRARAWCAVAVPCAGAAALAMLHAGVVNVWHVEDAAVKIDNRLKYILGMQTTNEKHNFSKIPESKPEIFTPKQDIETMLENMTFKKTQISPSVPCISIPGFKMPDFFKHTICDCYSCEIPHSYILSAFTIGLEAAMYFRAKEMAIARNYFEGTFKCFQLAERKLMKFDSDKYEKFIVEAVKRSMFNEFKNFEVEMLIEAAFFELSANNYEKADEIVVKIYEIMQDYDINRYLRNDVMNLMVTSAELRKVIKKNVDTSLEAEFEALKLSPVKDMEPPKTPEIKPKAPPKMTKITVKDEELPKKRKVIKLNLDDVADEKEKAPKKKSEFKIPVPVTSKHVLENITPRNTRSRPNILVTQPIEDIRTPLNEFSTPLACTPDEFFTPMSTLKTYTKKSLRHNIVKNLETEFATPKSDNSENRTLEVPKSRSRVKDTKKTLKRATSPGKLGKETTRTARRAPVKFSIDEDK